MKVLFFGLGSIGRRHLQLLSEIGDFQYICVRSGQGGRLKEFTEKFEIKSFGKTQQALAEKPDFAIISNPTSLHTDAAMELAQNDIPFLIEKPVSDRLDNLDELSAIVRSKNLPVMVGFQLRHHPTYQHLVNLIESGEIGDSLNLQGHTGQYLPDWRPHQDYRQSYSAKKSLGGGVVFDLCHEIDIAISIMGGVRRVSCISGHYSELEIETEDMAEISLEHEASKLSHIHLDCLERGYEWSTRVMGTAGTVIWNYGRKYLEISYKDGTGKRWEDPPELDRNWLFREQLKKWLAVLNGESDPTVKLDEGIEVSKVLLAAKRSSAERRHIEL